MNYQLARTYVLQIMVFLIFWGRVNKNGRTALAQTRLTKRFTFAKVRLADSMEQVPAGAAATTHTQPGLYLSRTGQEKRE
jgi:hypothetical protein